MKKSSKIVFALIFPILCFSLWGCGRKAMPHTVGLAEQEEKTQEDTIQEETADIVTVKTKRDIPWGFDENSYEMYMDGKLDPYIPSGSELEQCAAADLDLDGIEDLLLSLTISETEDLYGGYSYPLNTVILKGRGDNTYELAAENSDFNFSSSYDGSALQTAGDGWLKFSRSRGTGGGYAYSYLFQYERDKKDWLLSAYYYNQFGYTEQGISEYQSSENFGEISFREFEGDLDWDTKAAEKDKRDEELCVDTNGFQVTVSGCYVSLQDKEKEREVNKLIVAETRKLADSFISLSEASELYLRGNTTYMTPDIISIEFKMSGMLSGEGTVDSETAGSDDIDKYFTMMIDIDRVRRLTLSDVIDTEKLYDIILEKGFAENLWPDNSTAEMKFTAMSKEECLALLRSSDKSQPYFGTGNTGIFSAVYEKSLCIYIQPDFFGTDSNSEEAKLYISLEDILPFVKCNYWNIPADAATHIEWKG